VLDDTYRIVALSTPAKPTLDAKGLEAAEELNVKAGFMPESEKLKSFDGVFTNEYVK
jgi:hypothetical protein